MRLVILMLLLAAAVAAVSACPVGEEAVCLHECCSCAAAARVRRQSGPEAPAASASLVSSLQVHADMAPVADAMCESIGVTVVQNAALRI